MAETFTTQTLDQLDEAADLLLTDLVVIQRGEAPAQTAPVQAFFDVLEEAGADGATLAAAWAEGVEPGGPGTKSAKAHATDAAAAAAAAAYLVRIDDRLKTATNLPAGWVIPADCGVTYNNHFDVSICCDGLRDIPFMTDVAAVRPEWRGTRRRILAGVAMIEVLMERRFDPTLQGVAASVRYVHTVTGNNANDGLTAGTAWKTIPYAVATTGADGSIAVADIRTNTSTFYGGNAAGWDASTLAILKPTKITDISGGKWLLPGMRNSYTKALFAWTNMGGGIWKCSTGSISAAAKNSNVVFDLSVLDEDGAPTPSRALAGPYANEAAILAAMAAEPSFFYQASTTSWYVRLASEAEPDPGVNFAYVETGVGNRFDMEAGARLHVKGFRAVHNAGASSSSIWWFARPRTYTIGPAAPNVIHDNVVLLEECEIYGSSGNAFGSQSINRMLTIRCKEKYAWLDAFNMHTLYNWPASSNSIVEGLNDHWWVDQCVFEHNGPNMFKSQPAVNTSCNGPTAHARCRMTVLNTRGGFTHGAIVAATGGAKIFLFNPNPYEPTNTTTGDGSTSCKAVYWSDGNAIGDSTDGSLVAVFHGTGNVKNDGVMFYFNKNAKIMAEDFRGKRTVLNGGGAPGGGSAVDGRGVAL